MLCEVALASGLTTIDCIMTAEMIHTLAILLESAAERSDQTQRPGEGYISTICPVSVLCCFKEYHSSV